MMKVRNIIIMLAATAMALTACRRYEFEYIYGEVVALKAGVAGGSAEPKTKAVPAAGTYVPFGGETQLRLRVDGFWVNHSPEAISKTTTAKTAAAPTSSSDDDATLDTHAVSFDTPIFWDDYGTADPLNMIGHDSRGRAAGLTIYGVAVNKPGETAPAITSPDTWTSLAWTLDNNQSAAAYDPLPEDLLTSNNVKGTNTYKFDNRASGKLLEFTHAMSKITFNLIPGLGFESGFTSTAIDFTPQLVFDGTVNVEAGTTSLGSSSAQTLKLRKLATLESKVQPFDALIFPGNTLSSDDAQLAVITCDGNQYKITQKNLRIAMKTDAGSESYDFRRGKHYVVNVTIGKSGLAVTATIVGWDELSVTETPSVKVGVNQGTQPLADALMHDFSLFVRAHETPSQNYGVSTGSGAGAYFAQNSGVTYDGSAATKWIPSPILLWPDHNTHYHIRGVYPQVGTFSERETKPCVVMNTPASFANQVVNVSNTAYSAGTFPSDFAIGKPEFGSGGQPNCASTLHDHVNMVERGICATETPINLTFRYMMSQVEVRLKTTAGPDAVDLTQAKVFIDGVKTAGYASIESVDVTATGDRSNTYEIPVVASGSDRGGIPVANIRHASIVPQELTYTESSATKFLKFRIQLQQAPGYTVAAAEYGIDIDNIKKDGVSYVTPNHKWEPGKHYIYTFILKKTGVEVSAKIVDWVEADAETEVWF